MARPLAQQEDILAAARHVLERQGTVVTLRSFLKLVRQELRRETAGPTRLGDVRLRRLAAKAPFCRLEVRTRKGPRERVLRRCPVCGSPLAQVRNQTLFGGEVTLTLQCPTCPYWTGKEKRVPTLYAFHLEGGGRVPGAEFDIP